MNGDGNGNGSHEEIVYLNPSEIEFARDDGFTNPRHFHQGQSDNVAAQGLDDESMLPLFSDIAQRGVRNPLVVRIINGGTKQLVDGERRLLCALKAKLPSVPVYLHENMSDDEAWEISWRANDTAKAIGENATAALVKHWRHLGYSDDKILRITNRTSQWLRQMDVLGNLDPKSFEAHRHGLLSLRVALQLALVQDLPLRERLLNATLNDAQQDHNMWIAQQKKRLEAAEERLETAEAVLAVAEEIGTPADQEQAKIQVARASEAVQQAGNALAEAQQTSPQAKNANLVRASKRVGGGARKAVASSLSKAKLQKLLEEVDGYIAGDGMDGEEYVGEMEHLQIIRRTLDFIIGGDDDFKKMLGDYYDAAQGVVENEDEEGEYDDDDDGDDDDGEYDDEEEYDGEEAYEEADSE